MKNFYFDMQRFATIQGTSNSEYLTSPGTNSVVYGYGGADTIYNAYDFVTLSGGTGNDSIKSGHSYTEGTSRLDNPTTNNVSIVSGEGDDYITLNGGNSTVQAEDGNDIIQAFHDTNYLNGGAGNDSIYNGGANSTLLGESGDDLINNSGASVAIVSGDGNDNIANTGNNSYIYSGTAEDYIASYNASAVTIDSGIGNDTILSGANSNGLVYGGAGNDSINVYENTSNVTVNGGVGNDTISITSQVAALVQFAPSSDYDVIYGFDENDTLLVDDSFSRYISDNNVIVTTSNGTVNLVDAGSKSLNIVTGTVTLPSLLVIETTLTGTAVQDKFIYSGDTKTTVQDFSVGVDSASDVIVLSGGNIASISRAGQNIYVTMSDGNYIELQTNSSSSNDVIQYSADGTNIYGAKIADNSTTTLTYYDGANYYQLSQKGTLLVNNSTTNNIWLDGSAGKNFVNITDINASAATGQNILAGNGESNLIIGSAGISSLWGGAGFVSDTLIGGAGIDMFWYGKGDGADTIINAASGDTVRLYDINLSDIISAEVSGNVISAVFSTGGTLQISSSDSLSSTFRLTDGSWQFNHSTSSWQSVSQS